MYGANHIDDLSRFARAFLTDQLAWLMPRVYLRLTSQTGRGSTEETPEQIADYFEKLRVPPKEIGDFLDGKHVLEYGPGDIPGVGLLMYAHGAAQVVAVDRFSMVTISHKNAEVLKCLINSLQGRNKDRALSCFNADGRPESGFDASRLRYRVTASGISDLSNEVDLIVSRAVLEHVNDLQATFRDMKNALRPGGLAIHKVDLKSHGLHMSNPLDFLTWPQPLWHLMYRHKGMPNRWRTNHYRDVITNAGLQTILLEPVELAASRDVEEVYPHLASPFRTVSREDLSWLSFWVVLRRPADSGSQTKEGMKYEPQRRGGAELK